MNRPTQQNRLRVARRRFLRATLAGGVVAGLAACGAANDDPSLTVLYPSQGARVDQTMVPVRVKLRNFARTRAEEVTKPATVFFLVDTPLESLPADQPLPNDQPGKIVQASAADVTEAGIALEPGVHTVTVLLGDNNRMRLAAPAPQTITFFVQPGGLQTK